MQFKLSKVGEAKDYILTAFLLLIAISFAVSKSEGGLNMLRQISVAVVSVIQEPLSKARIYREALTTNNYLQRQNIELQDELSRLRTVELQNTELRRLLNLKENYSHPMIAATIVGKELTGINNHLTINLGSSDGIRPGMPFVNSDGLIGFTSIVSGNYSQVIPFYNNLFRVSARIQDNRAFGIVSWKGDNSEQLVLNFVPNTITVQEGFVVETSGASSRFPSQIRIGEVIDAVPGVGKDFQEIYLRPFVSLSTVAEGFVVLFEPDSSLILLDETFDELYDEN